MGVSVRCLKCWKRRVLPKRPLSYSAPWRLPRCDRCQARRYVVVKQYRKPVCNCGSLPYSHRAKSKGCSLNPLAELYDRVRQGESEQEALWDMALNRRLPSVDSRDCVDVPF